MRIASEYLGNDRSRSIADVIGNLPTNRSLFKNKHFLLTCTIRTNKFNSEVSSSTAVSEWKTIIKNNSSDPLILLGLVIWQAKDKKKDWPSSTLPFLKDHLRSQIEAGGGTVYQYFEEIPKNKYKYCKVVAAHPCTTAKYVQCLAAGIAVSCLLEFYYYVQTNNIGCYSCSFCGPQAVSHEYIIESCQQRKLADIRRFMLPTGWSLIDQRHVLWPTTGQRKAPLSNATVFVASYNTDFMEFWSRVCRLAGAVVRTVKGSEDVSQSLRGAFMLTDPEFCEDTKEKAIHFRIPIVSTVWVVESMVLGKLCTPDANDKLRQSYQDEDY